MTPEGTRAILVANALGLALQSGRLPERARPRASELLEALAAPVRISVVGPPGVGKTAVVNLLVGAPAVPDTLTLGVLQLVHGPTRRAVLTLRSGSEIVVTDRDGLARAARADPAMARLESPLEVLKTVSLTELALPDGDVARTRALRWLAPRTDYTIWCTDGFDEGERAAWATVPKRMRDASILLRTRIDRFDEPFDVALARLRDWAGEDFPEVRVISAHLARIAQAQARLNRSVFRKAGATALMTHLMGFIERRRQGIGDQAQFLLAHHGLPITAETGPTPPEPDPDAAPEAAPDSDDTPDGGGGGGRGGGRSGSPLLRIDLHDVPLYQSAEAGPGPERPRRVSSLQGLDTFDFLNRDRNLR
ncbi:MAG: hypothetical protein AAF366_06490 [Pseudomonadota bacterium]